MRSRTWHCWMSWRSAPTPYQGIVLATRSRKSRRTYISTRKIIICCVRAISCGCAPAKTIGRSAAARLYKDYFLEFVGSLLEGESGAIVAFLKSLQEDLGDLQDAVVSKQLLGDGDSDDGHVIARYEAAQDKVIAKLRRETREDFAQFVGEENRRRLLCAIANL